MSSQILLLLAQARCRSFRDCLMCRSDGLMVGVRQDQITRARKGKVRVMKDVDQKVLQVYESATQGLVSFFCALVLCR